MTKRDVLLDVHRCWNLIFWETCEVCKREFCREWGWWKLVGPYCIGAGGRWIYVCAKCCPTAEQADAALIDGPRYPRPTAPPPMNPSGIPLVVPQKITKI